MIFSRYQKFVISFLIVQLKKFVIEHKYLNSINAKGAKTDVHKNRMFAKLEDILEFFFFTLVALPVLGYNPFNPEHKGVVLELASCKWTGVT